MLGRILGDCGIVNYSPLWWEEFPRWDELLLEATGHPYETTFRRIREAHHNFGEMDKIVKDAHAEYSEIRRWFEAPHPDDYLGVIPADLRWVIGMYLRIRIEMFNTVTTYIIGDIESLDGEPAIVENNGQTLAMSWCRRGQMHRDGAPAYVQIGPSSLMCMWHHNADYSRPGSTVIGLTGNTRVGSCRVMQMQSYGRPDWNPTKKPEHLAEFATLLAEYWREVPGLIDFFSLRAGQSMTIKIPQPRYDFLDV